VPAPASATPAAAPVVAIEPQPVAAAPAAPAAPIVVEAQPVAAPAPALVVAEPVIPETRSEALLRTHGLNWTVSRERLQATGEIIDADGLPVARLSPAKLPNHYCTTRMDTEARFSPVGRRFQPVQNSFLAETLVSSGLLDCCNIRKAGAMEGGRLVFFELESKDLACTVAGKGKPFKAQVGMKMVNAHDSTLTLRVRPVLYLENGGDIPLFKDGELCTGWSIRHTVNLPKAVDELSKHWNEILATGGQAQEYLKQMGTAAIDQRDMRAILMGAIKSTTTSATTSPAELAGKLEEAIQAFSGGKTPTSLLDLAEAAAGYVDTARNVRRRDGCTVAETRKVGDLEEKGMGFRLKKALLAETFAFMKDRDGYVLASEGVI